MRQYDPNKLGLELSKIKAITTTEGPLLIIAGPGAGKTLTLVERIVYLIVVKKVAPEHIFVSTFTTKAAKELVTRVSNRLLELEVYANLNEMYIGTMHSLFLRILDDHRDYTRLKRSFRVFDDFDQQFLVFKHLKHFQEIDKMDLLTGGQVGRWIQSKKIVKYVNKISEECLDTGAMIQSGIPEAKVLAECALYYKSLMEKENALDFSTIQSMMLELLEERREVLTKLQDTFQYIMVDEYQDTNTIQERILLLLAGDRQNICVVGDDDQGLYRFRGASIRNILEFPKHFSKCNRVTLVTNYRSHPDIVDFYNRWMEQLEWDGCRYQKTIQPRNGDFEDKPRVIKVSDDGTDTEYFEEVYAFITHLKDKGIVTDNNQIAFLFKSVKSDIVTGLGDFLEARGIPIFSPRSEMFFDREEVQLMIGLFLNLIPNVFEKLKYKNGNITLNIWQTYERYKARFIDTLMANKVENRDLILWMRTKVRELSFIDKSATTYAFAALFYQALEFPMFNQYLKVDLEDNKTNLRAAYNLGILSNMLSRFEYLYHITIFPKKSFDRIVLDFFNDFLRFMIGGGVKEFENFDEYAPSGCISFMTIHQSKGLEFPVVVTGSLNGVPRKQYNDLDLMLEQNFYHKQPLEQVERMKFYDFWRLYYTAFSRPQNLLVLSTKEKEGRGASPSKYLRPIYSELPDWRDLTWSKDTLRLKQVKETNLKKEYSFTSHILFYENCSLQYLYYKELEFVEVRKGGAMGGQLLHQTIEDIHKTALRGETHRITNEQIEAWFTTNYELLRKMHHAYLAPGQLKALLKQVIRYKDRQQGDWSHLVEAEVNVSLVKADYILKGTIDLIEGRNDTVEIVDFKTGKKPDINTTDAYHRKMLRQYQRQLEIYAHLVEQRTGKKVSRMHLYYPGEESGSPYLSFDKDYEKIEKTIEVFDGVVKKIERKCYDPASVSKSEKLCGNCDMRHFCNPKVYA